MNFQEEEEMQINKLVDEIYLNTVVRREFKRKMKYRYILLAEEC